MSLVEHKPTGKEFALKSMKKMKLIELKQLDNAISEKQIMARISATDGAPLPVQPAHRVCH